MFLCLISVLQPSWFLIQGTYIQIEALKWNKSNKYRTQEPVCNSYTICRCDSVQNETIIIDRIALAKQGDTLIYLVRFICPSVCRFTLSCWTLIFCESLPWPWLLLQYIIVQGRRSKLKVKCYKLCLNMILCCHLPWFEVRVKGRGQRLRSRSNVDIRGKVGPYSWWVMGLWEYRAI